MDRDINEALKNMEAKAREIRNELEFYKQNPDKVAENALRKLTTKQIEECQIFSAVIAVKKNENSTEETAYNNGRLSGYLHCLYQMEIIDWIEVKALFKWFSEQDRSLPCNDK